MATILLAAGAAAGASIGGGVLGLSSVVIGRAIGATLGRVLDQRLLGAGSEPVETGRVDRFRLAGASEGAPIAQIYGRIRLAGQVIWATPFEEISRTTGGGKGMPSSPRTTTYSYRISLAVALCEGVITRVGRVWVDGKEVDREALNLRVYTGTEDQMPDAKIEAVNGTGQAPAYRGLAYVVIEDLNVTEYGNRVPQFNFEVFRPEQPDEAPEIARGTRAVALIPGTGEYALATTPVYEKSGTASRAVNVNSPGGRTDFVTSLAMLDEELPNCEAVSLVVSWFGDDLRCADCRIAPKVEHDGTGGDDAMWSTLGLDAPAGAGTMPWTVSGLSRTQAGLVPELAGSPVYGGTPTDQSVKQAIAALHEAGKAVTFYPFVLMEQLDGNLLPDPWNGGTPGQPALPWRGRITASLAPGQTGSPDGTAQAETEVAAFFGQAQPGDFTPTAAGVAYTGPAEFGYRRFILHYAHLCAAAGGVEAFLIGSELRGLTRLRGAAESFPAVAALVQLAADVREILGPGTKISYAADWTEYFGYHPDDGSGDYYFNLDPLWRDDNVDFIGIDNYMPLSDWRYEDGEADAAWGSIYNLDYLKSNILGGEGYDWFYHSPNAEAIQLRSPISDGSYGKDWMFRVKDLPNWWSNLHYDRSGGYELATLPLNGAERFFGDFSDAGDYWLKSFGYALDELADAPSAVDGYADVTIETVPGEGKVLQADSKTRFLSERGWHPFVPGQVFEVTVRFRIVSDPIEPGSHRHYAYIIGFNPDGTTTGRKIVDSWIGGMAADGWIDRSFTLSPDSERGTGNIPADAIGWRLVLVTNGYVGTDPAGAVQQISSISIESLHADSGWVPGSKPVWFTEMGCAAVDKGTNQPNRFLDPKSSESGLPKYSSGRRDDFIQRQYLRAMQEFWSDPANNPTDTGTGVTMLDMARAHVWAWDARPFPWFPADTVRWSDGGNYAHGHWLNGRASARSLASVVAEICARSGVSAVATGDLHGLVRGYSVDAVAGARANLQPLMLAFGIEAAEREGQVVFASRSGRPARVIDPDRLVLGRDDPAVLDLIRAPDAETAGCIRLNYVESDGDYETRAAEAVFPDQESRAVSASDMPLVLTRAEARAVVERWLAEARVARDSARFALPPSGLANAAGEVVELDTGDGPGLFRLDRIEQAGSIGIEAVRVEPGLYRPSDAVEETVALRPFVPAVPVYPVFMDLPLLTGDEVPHAPHLAATAQPWPGSVVVYGADGDAGYTLNRLVTERAVVGLTETPLVAAPPGLFDQGPALRVRLISGSLGSVETLALLNGGNAAAIGDGSVANWEVFQFTTATLAGEGVYELTTRLRGQRGSDALMPDIWPAGSLFVLLDGAPGQIDLPQSARGLSRHYRVGSAKRSYDDPVYVHLQAAFDGIGLRPFAPVQMTATRTVAGDLAVGWIRRSRIDGDSWQSSDIPLGEAVELYRIRVLDGETILREVTVGTPNWTYPAADQAADAVPLPFNIDVAQVSESFGPGPCRRLVVSA